MRKKTKYFVLRAAIVAVFVILAGRLWYVQVVMGSYYKAQGDTSKIRFEPVQALRGIVYDRNGRQLVFNVPSWSIEIVPHGVPSDRAGQVYARLSQLLGGNPSASKITAIVQANQWQQYAAVPVKTQVTTDTAMIIKQLHNELPGVRAEPTSVRSYLDDAGRFSLAQLLGYTIAIPADICKADQRLYPSEHVSCTDQTGQQGVEASMDSYLHGVNGHAQVEVDSGERPVRVLQKAHTIPGDSVYLTIDWKLQQAVSADLQAALQHLGLRQGVAILEDVHSGRILSMVSLPSYNNNWFAGGISTTHWKQISGDPAHPLNNLATQGQFAPGSTYKVITAAAALQTGVANASTVINDTGSIQPCPSCSVFHGWMPSGLGAMDMVHALQRSSDIYFYTVAGGNPTTGRIPHIGGTRLAYWARQFGLGALTGIELPNEQPGFVPTPAWFNALQPGLLKNPGDSWTIGYNYNSAIGQGFDSTTPLQMVNVAATIANGGTLYRPRIIEKISGRIIPQQGVLKQAQAIQPFVPSIIRRGVINPSNLALIQEGMHLSVSPVSAGGTSFNVVDKRIDAAGKTGTAEDNPRPAHAWWIGYAPYKHPKVAIVVLIPNAGSEGAYVAAPIAHKLLEDYFHLAPLKANWLDDVQGGVLVGAGGH